MFRDAIATIAELFSREEPTAPPVFKITQVKGIPYYYNREIPGKDICIGDGYYRAVAPSGFVYANSNLYELRRLILMDSPTAEFLYENDFSF